MASSLAIVISILTTLVQPLLAAPYPGRNSSLSCFGSENGCIDRGDCSMLATYQYNNMTKTVSFNLQATGLGTNDYVAMGISSDSEMGSDLVIFCPNTASGAPTVSYNIRKSNVAGVTGVTLTNTNQSVVNGLLSCYFTVGLQLAPVITGQTLATLDFSANNYYLLLANGPMSGSSLGEHDNKLASSDPFNLTVNGIDYEAADDTTGFKVHGCLMCLAWLATAPTGMLFARYYRKTWTSIKPCGKDSWFRFHQILMSTTVIVTIISAIVIFSFEGGDPLAELGDNPHPVIGLISIICAIIQPIMAFFRPHPGTRHRPLFNWAHRIVGNLALLFGIVAIFLAFGYDSINLPDGLAYAFIAWIFIYFVVQLALTIEQFSGKKMEESNGDDSGYICRKATAFIYISFLFAFAIVFIVVIIISS